MIDFVANRLASDWKRNARFLGIKEHELEQIQNDNSSTFERSQASLKSWIKNSQTQSEVSWHVLKTKSLTKIHRNDIIKETEEKFRYLLEGTVFFCL